MLIFSLIIFVILLFGNGVIGLDDNLELLNQIRDLTAELDDKNLYINELKKEICDWTTKYYILNEEFELTRHSLNMANEILNGLDNQNYIDDSDDYE